MSPLDTRARRLLEQLTGISTRTRAPVVRTRDSPPLCGGLSWWVSPQGMGISRPLGVCMCCRRSFSWLRCSAALTR